jgi:hypothetical protein
MGDTLGTVHVRRKEDSKLRKTMASHKLEQTRGFGMGPDSTFHQGKSKTMRKTGITVSVCSETLLPNDIYFLFLTSRRAIVYNRIKLIE